MILWTLKANGLLQEINGIIGRTLVDAFAGGQHVNVIEQFVHQSFGLMNCAHNCAAFVRQILQQTNTMGGR